MLMRPHKGISGKFSWSENEKENKEAKHNDWKAQFWMNGKKTFICVYENDRTD